MLAPNNNSTSGGALNNAAMELDEVGREPELNFTAGDVLNRANIGTYLLVIALLFIGTPVYSDTASAILPKDCRIQEMGAVQADGGYSFWHTEHYAGQLGDYVLVEEDGDVTFAVTATAQEQEGTGPLVRLTLTSPESGERVEMFQMKNGKHTYAKTLRLPKGFYTFVLRHTNRPTAKSDRVRNLKVFDVTVTGAVPAPTSEVAYSHACKGRS